MSAKVQLPLFDQTSDARSGLAHRTAGDTERAAAVAVAVRSGTQRATIYRVLADSPAGLTDWQITEATGILRSAVCARRNELVHSGHVHDSGRRRKEHTGAMAIVWETTVKK